MRKLLIIAIVVIVLLITAASAYYFFRSKNPPDAASIEPLGPKLLAPDSVVSAILSFSGETVWYFTKDGKLSRRRLDGTDQGQEFPLPKIVTNATGILWQQRGGDFIVEQNTAGHTRYQYYDTESKKFTEYPLEMRSVAILADDVSIAYDWVATTTKHELKTSYLDTTNFQKISDLFRPDYQIVASPAKNEIVIFGTDSTEPSNLVLVDLTSGSFTNIGEKAIYRGAKFSADGTKLLYSTDEGLAVYDFLTPAVKDLGVVVEIESAAWGKDAASVIYADREGIKSQDLASGQTTIWYSLATSALAPKDIFLHPSKNMLLFIDGSTGKLYSLEIR